MEKEYINKLIKDNTKVDIYLLNGVKLTGTIFNFDNNCIIFNDYNSNNYRRMLIYIHGILTIKII